MVVQIIEDLTWVISSVNLLVSVYVCVCMSKYAFYNGEHAYNLDSSSHWWSLIEIILICLVYDITTTATASVCCASDMLPGKSYLFVNTEPTTQLYTRDNLICCSCEVCGLMWAYIISLKIKKKRNKRWRHNKVLVPAVCSVCFISERVYCPVSLQICVYHT